MTANRDLLGSPIAYPISMSIRRYPGAQELTYLGLQSNIELWPTLANWNVLWARSPFSTSLQSLDCLAATFVFRHVEQSIRESSSDFPNSEYLQPTDLNFLQSVSHRRATRATSSFYQANFAILAPKNRVFPMENRLWFDIFAFFTSEVNSGQHIVSWDLFMCHWSGFCVGLKVANQEQPEGSGHHQHFRRVIWPH